MESKEPLTCFLVPILLIHLGPVEVPSRQDRPVSFIPDPQTGLQPQIGFLHPETRFLSTELFPVSRNTFLERITFDSRNLCISEKQQQQVDGLISPSVNEPLEYVLRSPGTRACSSFNEPEEVCFKRRLCHDSCGMWTTLPVTRVLSKHIRFLFSHSLANDTYSISMLHCGLDASSRYWSMNDMLVDCSYNLVILNTASIV